jgi:hypothetical protein
MAKKKAKKPKWNFREGDKGLITKSSLTNALIKLLRSPAVQSINFVFNAIIVSGSRMAELARAIEKFEIIVYHDTKCAIVPGKFDGYYSATDDALYLGFDDLAPIDNRMLALHECVHAISDIHGSAGITKLDDECAGYVACALYYRHAGHKYPKRPKATLPLVDAIYQAAFNLADAYLDKVANPNNEVQAMRAAILAVPIYKSAAKVTMAYNGLNHKMRSGEYALAASL